jgi:membrane protease YdiL (CAAX protease family)
MQDETHEAKANELAEIAVPKLLTLVTIQAVSFTLIGWAIWFMIGNDISTFVTVDARQIGMGIGLAIVMSLLIGSVFFLSPRLNEYLVRAQAKNFAFLKNGLSMPAIILISICAGVGEEALFRGGIQTLAAEYVSMPLAIIISSLLFTLIHLAKPAIALIIMVIGSLFGVIYWVTGSLLIVMIAHTLYDVFAIWYLQRELKRLGVFDETPAHTTAPQSSEDTP